MDDRFPIVRTPSVDEQQHSNIAHYMRWLHKQGHGTFSDYASLHAWSVAHLDDFWASIWRYTGVVAETPYSTVLGRRTMPNAEWFPGARLNFAENLLREALHGDPSRIAIRAYSDARPVMQLTYGELLARAAAFRKFLVDAGVKKGDRVAAVISHGPEAIIAMLATTSLGAVWSSASPDFGVNGILDRFGQIEPIVLITVNGYTYGGRVFSRIDETAALKARLPSVEKVVVVEQLDDVSVPNEDGYVTWSAALAQGEGHTIAFAQVPFDHPAFILYSSGTTGVPKCIVHGGGGTLLQHSKELILHGDIRRDDTFFYFTTTGWMMWNWQVSGLLTGAKLVLFDGNPGHPSLDVLWKMASDEEVTHFGTSAKFIGSCRNSSLRPGHDHRLDALRVIFSTGSPLLPEDYDYVYEQVKQDVLLGSISGGTDIVSCFVGACPIVSVRRGEIQCKMLGMDVKAFDVDGREVVGERGELVCTQPAPSMPVMFWNDEGGERYRKAYFDVWPGVWAHGDFISFSAGGGSVIHGRSDATLNPGGVRIGTAEIYRQVETMPEVADSIVVGQNWEGDVRVVLLAPCPLPKR
ncbi:MAG: acetoacetate--CoA ligase [Myxococcota bacterium]